MILMSYAPLHLGQVELSCTCLPFCGRTSFSVKAFTWKYQNFTFFETYVENGQRVKTVRGRESWADNVISQILVSLGNETKKKAWLPQGKKTGNCPTGQLWHCFLVMCFMCHSDERCTKICALKCLGDSDAAQCCSDYIFLWKQAKMAT